jgi:MoaA/NifB/PqqE/SkfB family radical SAM enzyme
MSPVIEFAQIEPTTRCNYTCGFCAGRSMRQGDLSWRAFQQFLEANPHLKHVELQGEGEPLMHPRFFDMVSACRARDIKVSLISNGSMLGVRAVDGLIEEGVESLHVSLESADPEEFQAIRGGKFQKVVNGLRLLMERRRELGKTRPTVGFSVTVLRRTLGAIHGIVALYKELGLDGGISIQLLQDMSCYTDNYDRQMLEQIVPPELWRDGRSATNAALATTSTQAGASSYYGVLFADFDPDEGKCPWLEKGAYLNIEGAVTGCCFMKSPLHTFGNVMTDSPEAIASRRGDLADSLHAGVIPPACNGCYVAEMVTRNHQPPKAVLPIFREMETRC